MTPKISMLLLFLNMSAFVFSQKTLDITIHQDTKFLFTGDERGNSPGTIDVLMKVEVPIKRFEKTTLTVYPSFEYADLSSGVLKRYAMGVGYIFNDLILKSISLGVHADYGVINRMQDNTGSFGLNFEVFYKINRFIALSYVHQITERTDLKNLYRETDYVRPSSFVGFRLSF